MKKDKTKINAEDAAEAEDKLFLLNLGWSKYYAIALEFASPETVGGSISSNFVKNKRLKIESKHRP